MTETAAATDGIDWVARRGAPSVFMVAGEPSGDWAGAQLARVLREKRPDILLRGIGGRRMAAAGVDLLADSSDWGAIGVCDALRKVPRVYLAVRRLKGLLARHRPSGVVLIDSGGLNIPLARMTRKLRLKILYYLPPGSWSRKRRSQAVSRLSDVIATPFPWSKDLLSGARARVEWVGHPVREAARPSMAKQAAWRQYDLDPDKPVVALAAGSRAQEMRHVLPVMTGAAARLSQRWEGAQFLVPVSDPVYEKQVWESFRRAGVSVALLQGMEYDALQLADAAAVCSGTATLEFACLGVPMVVVYRASFGTALQFLLVRGVLGNQWRAGMPNILAGRDVVPELLWRYAKPDALARELAALVEDEDLNARVRADLVEVVKTLGEKGASERTADLLLQLIVDQEQPRAAAED